VIEQAGETLVRIWGRPIGFVDIPPQASPEKVAEVVWNELALDIGRALREGNLAPIEMLTAQGIVGRAPSWKIERDRASRYGPPLAVVVCTRWRPLLLARALFSLTALSYHDLEIVVVNNAPDDRLTEEVVARAAASSPHPVRYVAEPRPGLSWARNAGVAATDRDLIAFTDDDVVVDQHWAAEIVCAFESSPSAGCVTGQILPFEFRSDASRWRESYAGADKFGFDRRVFDRSSGRSSKLFPFDTGACGSGMNMAFRRRAIDDIGGFDCALGAGTPSRGGEDLAAFFDVIRVGHSLIYVPSVLVSHAHRHTYEDLETQMRGWGSALTAYLTHVVVRDPRVIVSVLRRAASGFASALLPTSRKNVRKPADYPRSLTWAELASMPTGPARYVVGRWRARRLVRSVPR
jgi:GT2 family glycosyltransferase